MSIRGWNERSPLLLLKIIVQPNSNLESKRVRNMINGQPFNSHSVLFNRISCMNYFENSECVLRALLKIVISLMATNNSWQKVWRGWLMFLPEFLEEVSQNKWALIFMFYFNHNIMSQLDLISCMSKLEKIYSRLI